MGTPPFARAILQGLDQMGTTLRVVTKPDAPRGRGHWLLPSAVAAWALEHDLTLDRPARLADMRPVWEEFAPDLIVTAAYGRILPGWLLALPSHGAYNLHASLLPRWRGPNPIAWAIWAGDDVTGVTLMRMDEGVDTGGIVAQTPTPILPEDDLDGLTQRLAKMARDLLLDRLDALMRPNVAIQAQSEDDATLAPKFPPEMARMDWLGDAEREARRIRSMTPEPGVYTSWNGVRIKIGRARPLAGTMPSGEAHLTGDRWRVGCGQGILEVEWIQPAGKRWMTPGAYLRGIVNPPQRVTLK